MPTQWGCWEIARFLNNFIACQLNTVFKCFVSKKGNGMELLKDPDLEMIWKPAISVVKDASSHI